ncbi:MAG: hypothetical protein ACRDS0_41805 [Pseudonocardiaceae bacterium]
MSTSHSAAADPACDGSVFYRPEGLTLYTGDALTALQDLRGDSVDCVVTSPPHWRLRDHTTTDWSGGRTGCPHLASIPTTSAGPRRLLAVVLSLRQPVDDQHAA